MKLKAKLFFVTVIGVGCQVFPLTNFSPYFLLLVKNDNLIAFRAKYWNHITEDNLASLPSSHDMPQGKGLKLT